MATNDPDLEVRADGVGRRGEVGRRRLRPDGRDRRRDGQRRRHAGRPGRRGRDHGAAHLDASRRAAAGLVKAGPELGLPPGFSYHTFGAFGSAMSDGFITPPIHDGMACFDMGNGRLRIVRNHELGRGQRHPGRHRDRRPADRLRPQGARAAP